MFEVLDINRNKPHYNVMAICMAPKTIQFHENCKNLCYHRWIGTVMKNTNLFELECPKCRHQNSFASFLPDEYLEEFEVDNERS
jgi:hypothetical protein